jgi:GT2 family glycosyltransferase
MRETAAAACQDTVSVIICTRDRPDQLAHCLRSLQTLVTPPQEIIVVDNAPSSDATQTLVAQYPQVHYVHEPRPGLSVARNAGLRVATGDLIAFTDDDVEVHAHWLEQLRPAFRDPAVMAVTGLIIPAKLDTEAEQVFQRGSTGFGWGYRPLVFDHRFFAEMKPLGVPVWRIGAGANMAFRRSIFAEVGGFDPRLGAGASGCSEDSELWYRLLAAGWSCRYEPTAVVYHHHRADLSSLNQQMHAYMRGHAVALLVQAENPGHWGNIRRLAIALPRYYGRRLVGGCIHRFQGSYSTVLPEIRGLISGVGFYLRHRQSSPPL